MRTITDFLARILHLGEYDDPMRSNAYGCLILSAVGGLFLLGMFFVFIATLLGAK